MDVFSLNFVSENLKKKLSSYLNLRCDWIFLVTSLHKTYIRF
jgi:hypothetical protein